MVLVLKNFDLLHKITSIVAVLPARGEATLHYVFHKRITHDQNYILRNIVVTEPPWLLTMFTSLYFGSVTALHKVRLSNV